MPYLDRKDRFPPMNIFFDVDYTILGLDDTLRPGTTETFQKLKDDSHDI